MAARPVRVLDDPHQGNQPFPDVLQGLHYFALPFLLLSDPQHRFLPRPRLLCPAPFLGGFLSPLNCGSTQLLAFRRPQFVILFPLSLRRGLRHRPLLFQLGQEACMLPACTLGAHHTRWCTHQHCPLRSQLLPLLLLHLFHQASSLVGHALLALRVTRPLNQHPLLLLFLSRQRCPVINIHGIVRDIVPVFFGMGIHLVFFQRLMRHAWPPPMPLALPVLSAPPPELDALPLPMPPVHQE